VTASPSRPSSVLCGSSPRRSQWEYKLVLIGTAMNWFLQDITTYGLSLMNTILVQTATVGSTSGLPTIVALKDSLLDAWIVVLIALPGYFFAIYTVDIKGFGRFGMQLMGFVVSFWLFLFLATDYNQLASGNSGGFLFIYSLTYVFNNWGE
jgi:PHS family inorganic phosphate transporter-like MFS transporter